MNRRGTEGADESAHSHNCQQQPTAKGRPPRGYPLSGMPFGNTLEELGWRTHFQAQVAEHEVGVLAPMRVTGIARSLMRAAGPNGVLRMPLPREFVVDGELAVTVGDWVLVDVEQKLPVRVLERFGVFRRQAPKTRAKFQLIAANVDTLFIVTSADEDFNVARLERYLTLAREGWAHPVIVISKADLHDAVADDTARAEALGCDVVTVDARDPASVAKLLKWCGKGQTVAVVGSSGVGKSTLVNTLADAGQATGGIREADGKGKHTTTRRSMHRLADGGWLLDTPGMRELQLVDVADALADVFSDVTDLAVDCRFTDCNHDTEPGCAVQAAIEAGTLDPGRLRRLRKLLAEDKQQAATLAARRAKSKAFGKLSKSAQAEKKR